MTNFLHLSLSLTFLFLTGIASNLTAQTNLLTNPSFENYSNCPTGLSQSGYLSNWSIGTASPEYYNCSYNGNGIITGASSNGTGSLGIWGGPNHPSCVGEAYSESMTGTLGTAMENGKTYEVKFDLQLDGSGSATSGANKLHRLWLLLF